MIFSIILLVIMFILVVANEIHCGEESNIGFDYFVASIAFWYAIAKMYGHISILSIITYVAMYTVIGVVYSLFKSSSWSKSKYNKLVKQHGKEGVENYYVDRSKEEMLGLVPLWIIYWPLYLVSYVIKDIVEFIIRKLSKTYSDIFNSLFNVK